MDKATQVETRGQRQAGGALLWALLPLSCGEPREGSGALPPSTRPAPHLWPRAVEPTGQGRPEIRGPEPVLHGPPVLHLSRQ